MNTHPEIARRCPSCGASIRVRGLFCPQCGKPVAEQKSNSEGPESHDTAELADAPETVSLDLQGAPTIKLTTSQAETHQLASNQAATVPLQPPTTQVEVPVVEPTQELSLSAQPPTTAKPGTAPEKHSAAQSAVGRARAARDAIEGDVLQGVERFREISTVVLDEASYDPSLRFVLVAAVLFALFVIILILSEVIT